MSETSLKKRAIVKTKEVPPVENVVPFRPDNLPGLGGDFNREDRGNPPTISIIQAVGENAAKFKNQHGQILYDRSIVLPQPLALSFYLVTKFYSQNLAFDPDVRPLTFATAEEVLAHGGNLTKYQKPGADENNYRSQASARVCLEISDPKLAGQIDFKVEFAKKFLVPALWAITGTAYRRCVPLILAVYGGLAADQKTLAHARFTLSSKYEKVGDNYIYSTLLEKTKTGERNSDAYVAKMQQIFEG